METALILFFFYCFFQPWICALPGTQFVLVGSMVSLANFGFYPVSTKNHMKIYDQ
jgi:hypothetical protein